MISGRFFRKKSCPSLVNLRRFSVEKSVKIELKDEYGLYINGGYIPSQSKQTFNVENPFNGEIVSKIARSNNIDIKNALNVGYTTYQSGIWSNMDVRDRSEVLFNAAKILRNNINEIAYIESLQIGRPIKEMRTQLQRCPEWFEYYGSLIRCYENRLPPFKGNFINYVKNVPLGLVVQITPFNHPIFMAIKKIAPALATGNSIVIKPSELAPISVLELGNILKESGLPDGVLNVVTGYGSEIGNELCGSKLVRKVDFTGGINTGKIIGEICGKNICYFTAELGGKGPMIVFNDCIDNIDDVINGCVFGTFIASGQTCIAGTRLLIQKDIYDIFMEKLVNKVKTIKLGDPMDINTQLGPVISKESRDNILKYIRDTESLGGTILYGGKIPNNLSNGYFIEPTIITNITEDMPIYKDELFGPVVVCLPFNDENDAIKMANNSPFGLGASIWTNNIKIGHRMADKIDYGIIWINDHHKNDPSSPWSGHKNSGINRENGIDSLLEYTQRKSVIINYDEQTMDWFSNKNARIG